MNQIVILDLSRNIKLPSKTFGSVVKFCVIFNMIFKIHKFVRSYSRLLLLVHFLLRLLFTLKWQSEEKYSPLNSICGTTKDDEFDTKPLISDGECRDTHRRFTSESLVRPFTVFRTSSQLPSSFLNLSFSLQSILSSSIIVPWSDFLQSVRVQSCFEGPL